MSQMDYEVLVVGGGIHGVGVLHDLASRGVKGIHLVEKKFLAAGTSSRSTKMLHGGLRIWNIFPSGLWCAKPFKNELFLPNCFLPSLGLCRSFCHVKKVAAPHG